VPQSHVTYWCMTQTHIVQWWLGRQVARKCRISVRQWGRRAISSIIGTSRNVLPAN